MKSSLRSLFIVLALIFSARHTLAQVTNLGIASAGNQTVLFWSTSVTNSILQSTTNLASPNWVTVSNAVPLVAVAVTNTSPAMFFRLYDTNQPGMALVPAGSFTMGDTLDGESDATPTNVYVSAFYMDTNLVSYSQWQSIYDWATNNGYGFDHVGSGKATNQPVQMVDWYDCVKWSNARSQQAGLTPVYYTDAALTQVYTNGDVNITNANVNWAANGYRLPTEAEWEKAARGGLSGQRFPWGNIISETNANYYGNTGYGYDLGPNGNNAVGESSGYPYTTPVGYFAPNDYGLCDMAANVYEWCWDWYGTPYGQPTTNNPTGPITGSNRVLRGGDWDGNANSASCASRSAGPSSAEVNYVGLRCVIGL